MYDKRRARRARIRVRADRQDFRPFLFLMVLTAWMLLWTFDAALSAPTDKKTPGPLAAIGSVTVDGGGSCIGVLTAPRLVLTAANCLWDAEAGRWAPAREIRFVAGLKDSGFRGDARVLSYAVSPRFDAAQALLPAGGGGDWVLLELDDGLAGAVKPLEGASLEAVRTIGLTAGHPKRDLL